MYVVVVVNNEKDTFYTTFCETESKLQEFIKHKDATYSIKSIENVENIIFDYKDLISNKGKLNNMELGI
jgi:hypothetical protein